jgi:TRAP-type mannitol/chloroaromatic compound transport system permease small subunit
MLIATARLLERISLGTGIIAALLIAPLVLATCFEVFSRYVLGRPTIWAYEIGYMGMGAHFLLGGAYTLMVGGHIRVDVIYARYSERWKATLDLLGYSLLVLPFCAWLGYGFWEYFEEAYHWGERSGASAWNPQIWPFRLIMFTGIVLLGIQTVAEILRCLSVIVGETASLDESRRLEATP